MQFFRTGIGLFLAHYLSMIALVVISINTLEVIPVYKDWWIIVYSILIAPVKETILYQFIPKLVLDILGIRNYWIVLLSMSIFFSSAHEYSHFVQNNTLFSVIFTILIIVLTNYYLQVQKQETTINAIVKTIILHSLYNLSLDIMDFIIGLFA